MGWWVLAGVIVFLVFLALSRVHLRAAYKGNFQFEARFWFFRLRLPAPPGKPKPKPQKVKPTPKKPVSRPDWPFFLEHFSEVLALVKNLAAATGRRLVVDRLFIDLRIHEDDAADTAIRYGQACAVVYTASGFVSSALRVHRHEIRVAPVFGDGGESSAAFSIELSIAVFSIITLAATQGPAVIRMILSFLRSGKDATLQKDGALA